MQRDMYVKFEVFKFIVSNNLSNVQIHFKVSLLNSTTYPHNHRIILLQNCMLFRRVIIPAIKCIAL